MTLLWLSGWASDLNAFLPQIEKLFPDHRHRVLTWVELFRADPAELRVSLLSADRIIAWSQAGQLLLRRQILNAEVSASLKSPLLFVAPAFDFCRAGSGWPVSVLRAMSRAVSQDSEMVLKNFAEKLGATADEVALWIRSARTIDLALLAEGLMALAEPASASALQKISHLILQGNRDQIVMPKSCEAFSAEWRLHLQQVDGAAHWLLSPAMTQAIQKALSNG